MIAGNSRGPTVSAGFISALLAFAASKGLDRGKMIQLAGIDGATLADGDTRIPFAAYVTLMREGATATGNPAFALEFGAASDFRTFSVVGLIAHASPSMHDALAQLNRYGKLIVEVEGVGDGPRFEVIPRADGVWLTDRRSNPNDCPELTESTFSRFICWARVWFPENVFALEAHVTHPRPAHGADYERIWQVPVTFGSDRNAIRMNPVWPSLPIQPDARYVFGVLTERGEALLEDMERSRGLTGRIEKLLLPRLHTGEGDISAISKALGMSRQTLYRHLKAEGTSFAQVLDSLRHRLALDYLAGKHVSVNETAYLVGFSDPASFSRAFKRWTGQSPKTVRLSR